MKIAINALSARAGGGISAFVNLLPSLARIDKDSQYIIFISKRQKEILEAIPKNFETVIIDYTPPNPYIRVAWEQIVFPLYLLYYRVDVLYSVGNITTLLAPCKIVLLIENLNPYSLANVEWPRKEMIRNKFLKYLGWLSAKRANKIRFVSEDSKNLLIKLLNLPRGKCVTIYHGFNDNLGELDKINEIDKDVKIGYNYILTVAVVAPHKNLHQLIEAYDLLVRRFNYSGNLLIVGDLCYQEYVKKLHLMISKLNLNDKIIFTGKVDHKKIKYYYVHADVFVLPSIEETFGIPVIEAMGYGVPVAVSDGLLPSIRNYFIPFREICGDAAHYFNPFDPADIAEGIYKIITDKAYKEQLIMNGLTQVKRYNWDDTAKSLYKIFEEVCKI